MNQATTVTQTTSAFEVAGGFDFSTSGGTAEELNGVRNDVNGPAQTYASR
jgi:hypothetical protein